MINSKLNSLLVDIKGLKPDPRNARRHSAKNLEAIKASLQRFGQQKPIVILKSGQIVAGNGTVQAAKALGWKQVAALTFQGSQQEAQAFAIADNRTAELAEWDMKELQAQIKELGDFDLGFDNDDMKELFGQDPLNLTSAANQTLAEKFIVPPFSILDARQGYWKARKAAWLSLGIESEVGRGKNLLKMSDTVLQPNAKKRASAKVFGTEGNIAEGQTGTSIFDPVLCELIYRWFCPKGGSVLDPFAGGSVRGVVASRLGLPYAGVELRKEQVDANVAQAKRICSKPLPRWFKGDALECRKLVGKERADLIFSCPPYFDLEVYSDEKADLSNMSFEKFSAAYEKIVAEACSLLKADSFACFVVGDIRDKKGFYRNFVSQTIQAFEKAGLRLYNEAILITSVGTLSIRAGRVFSAGRKLGKTHQNVLIFFNGNPDEIKKKLPKVEVELPIEAPKDAEA